MNNFIALVPLIFAISLSSYCSKSKSPTHENEMHIVDGSGFDESSFDAGLVAECGNGLLEATEMCDDGNTEDGDTCDSECKIIDICPNGILTYNLEIPNRNHIELPMLGDCHRATGNLLLSSGDLGNLEHLQSLSEVQGDLFIGKFRHLTANENSLNTAVKSIKGLENLVAVGGDLVIVENYALPNLKGLGNLVSVGGDIVVYGNNSLSNLDGLDNLTEIGGDFVIYDNGISTDLNGPTQIKHIGGDLIITSNIIRDNSSEYLYMWPDYPIIKALENLNGFDELETIGGDFIIQYNDALSEIEAFGKLASIGGSLQIWDTLISDIGALEGLSSIGGDLVINSNTFEAFSFPFDKIEIKGDLYIQRNEMWPTCDAISLESDFRQHGFTGDAIICENLQDECGGEKCDELY